MGNPPEGDRLAKGHSFSRLDSKHRVLPSPRWDLRPASPAGGLYTTAEDLARFLVAHLNGGGGIIKAETASDMQRVHAADGAPDSGMGLGWRVTRSNGRRLFCHGGDGAGYTAFAGGYPDQNVGVVVLIDTGGAQGARSLIANGVLALLAGADRPRQGAAVDATRFGGRYRSNFWSIVADVTPSDGAVSINVPVGLINAYREETSHLDVSTASDGIFGGFQVSFFEDHAGNSCFAGGVYPYVFTRENEVIPPEEPTDETAVLTGEWSGTIETPIGALAATLRIEPGAAFASTPFGQDIPVTDSVARGGLVEGEFPLTVPGVGESQMFLRLRAVSGGRLTGNVYARMNIGEIAMQVQMKKGSGDGQAL
jgi:hypothetical protein